METWKRHMPTLQQTKRRLATYPSMHRPSSDFTPGLMFSRLRIEIETVQNVPPLADFIYETVANQNVQPDDPNIVNPRYMNGFEKAYQSQINIGWDNFLRGYISKHWKAVQYEYYKEIQRKDIHAVDKWARMLIKTVLEFNRTMWKNRCNIINEENKATYDQRQRMDITRLFQYLKDHPDKVPNQSAHFMDKHESFFERSNLNVLLMWKRGLEVV